MTNTVTFTRELLDRYKQTVKYHKERGRRSFVWRGQLEEVKHAEVLIKKLEESPSLTITL